MTETTINEIDDELIREFLLEFEELYKETTQTIKKLSTVIETSTSKEDKQELINSLFRGVHTIKSDLQMVNLSRLSDITHKLEDILSRIRTEKDEYTIDIGKIMQLSLNEINTEAKKALEHKEEYKENDIFSKLMNAIPKICTDDKQQQDLAITNTLQIINGTENSPSEKKQDTQTSNIPVTEEHIKQDLIFFKAISNLIGTRIPNHNAFIENISELAIAMNEEANSPVEKNQLITSIYLLHLEQSFIPLSLLNKKEGLKENISALGNISASIFLKNAPYWQPAAEIISQYHEISASNDSSNKKICPGAKILIIAQTFAAIINSMPYSVIKSNSIPAGIMEINKRIDIQFDSYWVNIFNQTMKSLYKVKEY